ncbi:MAG: asparaginase [Actinobacteria bacterium]|nr:MAG: asparaginase [Actinomycetota bacterium]
MDPVSVAVHRGPFVESVHLVHAVAIQDGAIVAEAGDPAFLTSLRSSAKPFQALPLVRSRDDLDDEEIAIASASHRAEAEQIEAVRRLLAKAPATEEDLEVGLQDGRPPQPIFHNCSGKHAGMLATCRARGWPTEGYRLAGHPLQDEILAEIAAAAELDPSNFETAVDGCGVVCFALPLERVAFMFSRFETRTGGARVAAAMRAHPQLVGGAGRPDTELMRALPGWVAKGGAEALFCAAGPDGLGVALKTEDGGYRALRPAIASFLAGLGHELGRDFERVSVRNSRGEEVGGIVAEA